MRRSCQPRAFGAEGDCACVEGDCVRMCMKDIPDMEFGWDEVREKDGKLV